MSKSKNSKFLKGRNKFLTGFCSNGFCEGTKPVSPSGKAIKTCEYYLVCPCECHERVDELFSFTKVERKPVPNPEYMPDFGGFVMPLLSAFEPSVDSFSTNGNGSHAPLEHPVERPTVVAPALLAERRTDTGRAARGGLEAQVWEACSDLFSPEKLDLTPKLIAEYIVKIHSIPTPSSGAIDAVLTRWDKIGFAIKLSKPIRFGGFKSEGSYEELIKIKTSLRNKRKITASAARRGYR